MPNIRDDVEPGTYAGLLVVNRETGHAELRDISALLTELDGQGNGISQSWVVRGRDGLTEISVAESFPEELWSNFLVFPDSPAGRNSPVPSTSYFALGTPIVPGTTSWDHLDADLEQIRAELAAAS